jgi:hypothetical protein
MMGWREDTKKTNPNIAAVEKPLSLEAMKKYMRPRTLVFYMKEPPLTKHSDHCAGGICERMRDLAHSDQGTFWVIGYDSDILYLSQIKEIMVLVADYSHIAGLGEAVIHNKTLRISNLRKTTNMSEAE